MFMNARPRPDLNGFRTFVPSRIVELSYHHPYSMTNHGTNTWSTLRGTTSLVATPDVWSYRPGVVSNSESYLGPVPQASNLESSVGSAARAQVRVGSNSMPSTSKMEGNLQLQPTNVLRLENRSHYGLQEIQLPHQESVLPLFMTDTDPDGWNLDHSAANSSRYIGAEYPPTACSVIDESNLEVDGITSTSPLAPGSSFFNPYETLFSSQSFASNEVEAAAPYISSLEQGTVSHSLPSTASRVVPYGFNAGRSWDEIGQKSNSADSSGMIMPFTYDGLPHGPHTLWSTQLGPSPNWSQQTALPGTVSPHALSLLACSSPSIPSEITPISSSGWHSETSAISQAVQDSIEETSHSPGRLISAKKLLTQTSGNDMSHSALQATTLQTSRKSPMTCDITHPAAQPPTSKESRLQHSPGGEPHRTALSEVSSPTMADDVADNTRNLAGESMTSQESLAQQSAEKSQYPASRILRPRRKLPSQRKGEAYASLHTNSSGILKNFRKGLVTTISRANKGIKDKQQPSSVTARPSPKKVSAMQRPLTSEKREIRLTEKEGRESPIDNSECSKDASKINDNVLQRIAKDKFLLDSKKEGKSYKQIRKEGCFTEAESTLRGRHRTLTKRPEERVRKPEWESNDLRLLKDAIHKLAGDSCLEKPKKVSWKAVSNYIVENGGSYRFGNSTCRKKWSELYAKSSDQDMF